MIRFVHLGVIWFDRSIQIIGTMIHEKGLGFLSPIMDAKSLSFELDSQTEVLRADYYRKDFCKKKEKSHFYALNECIHFAHAGISVEFVPHMMGQEPLRKRNATPRAIEMTGSRLV